MPTYRQTPDPAGAVVASLPAVGAAAPTDIWLEVEQEENADRGPEFAYFLLVTAGQPFFPNQARTTV